MTFVLTYDKRLFISLYRGGYRGGRQDICTPGDLRIAPQSNLRERKQEKYLY